MVLARFVAHAGVASRRGSEKLIKAGKVSLNGQVCREPSLRIDPSADRVSYEGKDLKIDNLRYFLLHKPTGYTCTNDDQHAEKKAVDLIKCQERLFSIGRLDKDSEGLLLFTNDGDLAYRLTHPKFQVPKTYELIVAGKVKKSEQKRLLEGIRDDGDLLKAHDIKIKKQQHDKTKLELVLMQGKNREIRRMMEVLGHSIMQLRRTRFASIKLGEFAPGLVRELRPDEVEALKKL